MHEQDILSMIKLVQKLSEAQVLINNLINSDKSFAKGVPYAFVECESAITKARNAIKEEAIDAFKQALNS